MKNFLSKCHEMMTMQQVTYKIIRTIKNIKKLLVYNYQDKQKLIFLNKLIL